MGSDMLVALGTATANGSALFALNSHGPARPSRRLVLQPGRAHVLGERVRTALVELPQVRQTWTTLGYRAGDGWGYQHGVNEHGVAAGCASWRTVIGSDGPGLYGADLVRLVLERATHARQAVDVLTDLLSRHGAGRAPGEDGPDHVFLIAAPRAAYMVETAGRFWALQEIAQVRAAGDVGVIRQDWNRLAPGLSGLALRGGHWPEDGSKLDFAGALAAEPAGREAALRRWGRATILLEEQNGHIDTGFARRLLGDHYEGTRFEVDPLEPSAADPVPLCRHDTGTGLPATRASLVAELTPQGAPARLVWYAFGPPCLSLYFPILVPCYPDTHEFGAFLERHAQTLWRLSDHLGRSLGREAERWEFAGEKIGGLQARFDEEAEEFCGELPRLAGGGNDTLSRQVRLFLERHAEQFEDAVQALVRLSLAAAARPSRG